MVTLFVTRSGPRKGEPECEAAFNTKDEAVRFLADLHGLEVEQVRQLRRDGKLRLKAKLHGSEQCVLNEESMPTDLAKKALSGELYIPDTRPVARPVRGTSIRLSRSPKC